MQKSLKEPQLELPLEKRNDPAKKQQASILTDQFMRLLSQEDYRLEFASDSMLRICGVHEGELIFAMRCKVFKTTEKDQQEK